MKTKHAVLLLTLLLTACAVPSAKSPEKPYGAILATQPGVGQVSPILASPTVSESTTRATAAPSEVQSIATKEYLVVGFATANAQIKILQDDLQKQNAMIARAEADKEQAIAETSKYTAANSANLDAKAKADLLLAAEKNRTLELQNEAAQLEAERLKAQAAAENARTQQYLLFFVSVLSICAALLVARLIRVRVAPVVALEPDPHPELNNFAEKRIPAIGTSVKRETPPGWSTELMIRFAQAVRRPSNTQGTPLTRNEWVGADKLLTRPLWNQLEVYICAAKEYAYPVNATGSIAWTPDGELWLSLFDDSVLPHSEENPISA